MTWWDDFQVAIENKDYDRVGSMLNEVSVVDIRDSSESSLLHYVSECDHENLASRLLAAGCDVNVKNRYGETPLMVAVTANSLKVAKLLLHSGADHINTNCNGEFGPLHMAVWYGFQDMVKILLEAGADVNVIDEEYSSSLHIAAKVDYTSDIKRIRDIAKLLIDAGSDVDAVDFQAKTPLHWATEQCNYTVAELLLDADVDVDVMDDNFVTPLHWAVRDNNFDFTRRLIEAGSDVDQVDCHGMTCLHYAVKSGMQYDMVRLLLEFGATPNCTDDQGYSPLHWAVREGNLPLVNVLLGAGADVNIQDDEDTEGLSALQVAAELGFKEIITLLLDNKADIKAKCNRGYSVLYYAAMSKRIGSNVGDDLYVDILKLLLTRGADIENDSYNIKTPFNSVLLYGNERAVKIFLEYGVDLNKCILKRSKISSLHHAALNSDKSVLKFLVDSGHFDIEEKCGSGLTALHLAAFSNQVKCIKFLLKRGANINADNIYGETPLYSAILNKHSESVRLLLAHEANIDVRTTRAESILGVALEADKRDIIQNIIKHIAKLEALNVKVGHTSFALIKSFDDLQDYYEVCKAELTHMEECVIFGSVSFFNILTDRDIGSYARNEIIKDVFNQDIQDYFPNYCAQLEDRFSKEVRRQALMKDATKGLSRVLRLDADTFHVIFYKIFCYLNNKDFRNLSVV